MPMDAENVGGGAVSAAVSFFLFRLLWSAQKGKAKAKDPEPRSRSDRNDVQESQSARTGHTREVVLRCTIFRELTQVVITRFRVTKKRIFISQASRPVKMS